MKKYLIFFVVLVFSVMMSACGESSDTHTYQFLSFGTPAGFTYDESSEEPFFDDGEGHYISVMIEEPDMLTIEEMLQVRRESSSETNTEVTQYDDREVAGIMCQNCFVYSNDTDTASGEIYMPYDGKLVTFSLGSYNGEISEELASRFGDFLDTVQIIK